ncbi:hypothetical protein D3C75_185340 [compost metagenome]
MKSQDIFTGGSISVAIGNDITNTNLNGLGFIDIPEISAFPEISSTRNSIKVPSFSSADDRTLIGRRSHGDTTLSVNYIPGNVIHERLITTADGTSRIQLRVTYWVDQDRDYGVSFLVNGFLSSDTLSGDAEAAVTRNFTIAIDRIVAKGILDLTNQGSGIQNPLSVLKDFAATLSMKTTDTVEIEFQVTGGYPPYSYRWYKDGQLTQIGSTTTTLDLTGSPVGTHVRKVIVSDGMGQTIVSNECTVTVTAP